MLTRRSILRSLFAAPAVLVLGAHMPISALPSKRIVTCNVLLRPARDLYLSTNGSDLNDGLSPDTAFATVQKAYQEAITNMAFGSSGVTVHIAPGNYIDGFFLI